MTPGNRYPFLRLLLPLMAGIVCGDALGLTLWLLPLLVCILVGVLLLVLCHTLGRRQSYSMVLCAVIFCAGCYAAAARWAESSYDFAMRETVCRVRICGQPEEKPNSILCPSEVLGEYKGDSLVTFSHHPLFLLYFPKDTLAGTLRRGDELMIHARLSPPQANGNPDEFDYAKYLRRNGGSGTAYVPAGHWRITGHLYGRTLRQAALDCRERIVELYRSLGFEGDELAVLAALTVGDQDDLSEDILETYSVSGVSHVLSLSGLHIGFLYMLLIFCCAPLWKRRRRLKPFLLILVVLLLWAFAFITGLASPVVRSVVMFSLLALSSLQREKPLTMNTLAATAFLMLLVHPLWLFDVGFQLSFIAVASILLFQPRLYAMWRVKNRFMRYVWGLATVSVAAQIGTAPLVLLYFGRFSVHFLLSNLLVVPLSSLVLYVAVALLIFTPFPTVQQFVANVLEILVRGQNDLLREIEALPASSVDGVWMDKWEVALLYISFLLLYRAWGRFTGRNVCMALFALLLFVSYRTVSMSMNTPEKSLYFYNVRNCPAVHCTTEGPDSWLVTADSVPDVSRLFRSLAPHWNRLRLDTPRVVTDSYECPVLSVRNLMLLYGGKRVCILRDDRWKGKRSASPLQVDYLYVCRGYKGTLSDLEPLFKVGKVVIDVSLTDFYRNRMLNECRQKGIPYHVVSQKGYLHILL